MTVARQLTVTGGCCLLLGDCWFVAAAASLACRPKLFRVVVPDGQQFDRDYAGPCTVMFSDSMVQRQTDGDQSRNVLVELN